MALQVYNQSVWQGADATTPNSYKVAGNWEQVSIGTSSLRWTASGSGTNEYYLEASGGGNPNIGTEPGEVYETATTTPAKLTAGTAGSLAAGEWDWADNDTLGFSTVYVRTTAETDPDSTDEDDVTFARVPSANDDVHFSPHSDKKVSAGLENRATSIDNFFVDHGYNQAIGVAPDTSPDSGAATPAKYLHVTLGSDLFFFAGGGAASFIDLTSSTAEIIVERTASAATGLQGLHLLGSALGEMTLTGSQTNVGVGSLPGETATLAGAVNVTDGARLVIGEGVGTSGGPTAYVYDGGTISTWMTFPTVIVGAGGTLNILGQAGGTTITIHRGGRVNWLSTGNITTVANEGGILDATGVRHARTISTYEANAHDATFFMSEDFVTITTFTRANIFGDYALTIQPVGGGLGLLS